MKKRDVINIAIVIFILIYIVFYKTLLINKLLRYEGVITSFFLIILTFIVFLLLGYRNVRENLKRKTISSLLIYEIIIYFFIYFGLGLLLGFQNNVYSMKIDKILLNMFCPLIMVLSGEVLRNIVIQANKDRKIVIVLITILLAVIELMGTINYYDLNSASGLFKMVACGLLPLMAKHSALSYLTYYTGLKNSLIYGLTFTLYVFVVPILPNLGEYIACLIDLIFPFVVYMTISGIVAQHDYVRSNIKVKKFTVVDGIVVVSFALLVCLVGGVFKYKLIAIASDSMNPYFYRGDSVFIEKINNNSDYKVGDVISFDYNGRTTVHRIVEIEEIDGEIYYHTKGDNNNSEDIALVPINNVYGHVLFRIPYIGYPSVIINEHRSDFSEKD